LIFSAREKIRTSRRRPRIAEPRKNRDILASVDPRLKEIGYGRLAVLRGLHHRLSKPGRFKTKEELRGRFLDDLNSGILWPDGIRKFISHIGRSTLYAWDKLYRNGGILALVPRYGTKSSAGRATFWPLEYPIELKLSGPPRRNGRADFRTRLKRHWKNPPLGGPIHLSIFYSMPIPKKTKMPRRMKMLKGRISHQGKPNLDALNAFVVGCMTGIVFKDHCQILQFHSEKKFGWWPQTRILVRELPG
jgi:Holliday junction resolvase RusA-like endonuclease